jgi:hypothetical protein
MGGTEPGAPGGVPAPLPSVCLPPAPPTQSRPVLPPTPPPHTPSAPTAAAARSAPGAVLRRVVLSGCSRTAVAVRRAGQDSVGAGGPAYPPDRPASLRRVTFDAPAAAAVIVSDGAAAALSRALARGCGSGRRDRVARYPCLWARAGSSLAVESSQLLGSLQEGLLFSGASLSVRRASFAGGNSTALRSLYKAPAAALFRGGDGPPPPFSVLRLEGARFESNAVPPTAPSAAGGAVFLGKGCVLTLDGCRFVNNSADAGAGAKGGGRGRGRALEGAARPRAGGGGRRGREAVAREPVAAPVCGSAGPSPAGPAPGDPARAR